MDLTQEEMVQASPNEESPAQKQARIRRERREAKIKAGGSARLEKITNLSGRPAEPGTFLTSTQLIRLRLVLEHYTYKGNSSKSTSAHPISLSQRRPRRS
jgi:hypothetical protein